MHAIDVVIAVLFSLLQFVWNFLYVNVFDINSVRIPSIFRQLYFVIGANEIHHKLYHNFFFLRFWFSNHYY